MGGIAAGSLREGDVLLVAGGSIFSRLVRLIEGTSFDHCLLVASADPAHPKFGRDSDDDRTDEPWAFDIGFFGGRHQPLSSYDDVVEAVAVRRHRSPYVGESVVERARTIVGTTKGYAWDRLLFLSLIGATRWSPSLGELSSDEASAMVRALYEVLAQMQRAERFEIQGQRRICTELVVDAFDVFAASGAEYDAYLGLVTPTVPHEGLLWWAAGLSTFQDFLTQQPAPKRRGILDEELELAPGSADALRLVHEAAAANGVSFPGFHPADDKTLRLLVIDGVQRTLEQLLMQPRLGDAKSVSDPRRVAWFLLDTLMRHRAVVTPADLARTSSLCDVGLLDHNEINWRKSGT